MNSHVSEAWATIWTLVPLLGMTVAARAADSAPAPAASGGAPAFTLPALPYAQEALEPYVSAKTMSFHYGKHHQTYIDNLNKAVAGTPWAAGTPLEKVVSETAAVAQFGSGWVWLVQDGDALKIVKTSNADTPIAHGQTALLTCDVWKHAYYLDYQNRRKDFVQAFLDHLADWEFAASQLK